MTEESEALRKVVINGQHGGFSLSPPALLWLYAEGMTGIATPVDEYWTDEDDGGRFSKSHALAGACARLRIIEIPADAAWEIDEYDGLEWVAEKHRRWS